MEKLNGFSWLKAGDAEDRVQHPLARLYLRRSESRLLYGNMLLWHLSSELD